ncbi:uncharacterized protein N7515_005476 [Penicillium bovifimosum]|uniref:Uncharacterized protein n=1 Tax=Penicillium bovifimosum TaxID=126998 RepID=A0A9W9L083_9EURO|nr:uncharacterized protein N7515_005476 [Penicillium bovifimosum]KAJ5129437.1 hypothetical protein N7515_005476 [Penicillium bovifimosum]
MAPRRKPQQPAKQVPPTSARERLRRAAPTRDTGGHSESTLPPMPSTRPRVQRAGSLSDLAPAHSPGPQESTERRDGPAMTSDDENDQNVEVESPQYDSDPPIDASQSTVRKSQSEPVRPQSQGKRRADALSDLPPFVRPPMMMLPRKRNIARDFPPQTPVLPPMKPPPIMRGLGSWSAGTFLDGTPPQTNPTS